MPLTTDRVAPCPPDVVDDLTRREPLAGATVLLLTAGPPRTFADARGIDVAVPEAPRSVVFLDEVSLVNALTLGFCIDRIAGGPLTAYAFPCEESQLGALDIFDTGIITELNVEALLNLAPDLVVASLATGIEVFEDDIERLEAGGLVVAQTSYDTAAFDGLLASATEVGKLLGIEGAEERTAEVPARVDALADVIGDDPPTAQVLRVLAEGTLSNRQDALLDALGLPGNRPDAEQFARDVSAENLVEEFDAEVLLYYSFEPSGAAGVEQVETNPLWSSLLAVTADRAEAVEGGAFADFLLGIEARLQTLEEVLG